MAGVLVPAEWIQAAAVLVATRGWRWVEAYGAVLALALRSRTSDDAHDVVAELGIVGAEAALEGVGLLSGGRIVRPGRRRASGPRPRTGELFASPAASPSWIQEAAQDYRERFPDSAPPYAVIGKALKPYVLAHGWDVIRPGWQRFLGEQKPEFAGPSVPGRFVGALGWWVFGKGEERAQGYGAGATLYMQRRGQR